MNQLSKVFIIGSTSPLPFSDLGLSIQNSPKGYWIDQRDYIEKLTEIDICDATDRTRSLSASERSQLRGLLGKLLWPAVQSRPDICFIVSQTISRVPHAAVEDALKANKIVRKLRNSSGSTLFYPNMSNLSQCKFIPYSDASLSNNSDGSTQYGYFVFIANQSLQKCCLIAWKSCKLKRIVRSTLAAEALAAIEGADCAIFCKNLIHEISGVDMDIFCQTDNASLVDSVYSTKSVLEMHLRVDIEYLRDLINQGNVRRIAWLPTKYQLADSLTKLRSVSTCELTQAIESGRLNLAEVLK